MGQNLFFFSFSVYLNPIWIEILPEWYFLIFWIFLLFFWNFLPRDGKERNSGWKIFSLFLGLFQPSSDRNNARMMFFNFFAISFGIFMPESSRNGIRGENFFLSFSIYLNPIWIEIIPEWCFLIFWIFLLFFLEFSSPGWIGTVFITKFFSLFLGLSSLGLERNIARMMFFNFLNFFGNFLARVG